MVAGSGTQQTFRTVPRFSSPCRRKQTQYPEVARASCPRTRGLDASSTLVQSRYSNRSPWRDCGARRSFTCSTVVRSAKNIVSGQRSERSSGRRRRYSTSHIVRLKRDVRCEVGLMTRSRPYHKQGAGLFVLHVGDHDRGAEQSHDKDHKRRG